jgi:very-short-patch-repair endonuclease
VEVVRGHPRRVGYERVTQGLHVRTPRPLELVEKLRALTEVLPPSAVCTHLTAAAVRGWWLPPLFPHPVFVAVPVGDRYPERRGIRVARLAVAPAVDVVAGLALASGADTLLALARDLAPLDLVPLADSALRSGDCSMAALEAVTTGRRRGAPALRAVLPLLDRRSESAWESVLRVLHRAAEVDVVPQHEVRDELGGFVARADLWLRGTRRIHEYDGAVHRDPGQHRRDLDRDRRLVEVGWQRCGYTAPEVLHGGARIIASADAVLGRAWEPRRLRAWQGLVADSVHTPAGRARVTARWEQRSYDRSRRS